MAYDDLWLKVTGLLYDVVEFFVAKLLIFPPRDSRNAALPINAPRTTDEKDVVLVKPVPYPVWMTCADSWIVVISTDESILSIENWHVNKASPKVSNLDRRSVTSREVLILFDLSMYVPNYS